MPNDDMPHPAPASMAKPDWAMSERERRRRAQPVRRARWPWVVVALLAAALAAVLIWDGRQGSAPETVASTGVAAASGEILLHPLDVTEVERDTLRDTLRISGTLQPRTQVQINSRLAGTVAEVHARLGDRVTRGALLAQIDVEALRAQLAQQTAALEASRAQYALAEAEAARAEELARRGVSASVAAETAQSNLAVQRANVDVQQAAVAAAEITLNDASIHAPIDGIIAERAVELGQTVAAGATLFRLADLSVMTLEVLVPVAQTVQLERGQAVAFTVEGLPGRSFGGRIEGVSPTAASGSRNAPVSIVVDNPDLDLRGGMYATGEILLRSEPDAVAVPRTSVREDDAGSFVLKIEDGSLVRQPVETGSLWQGDTLIGIESGLEAGERIVSGRLPDLTDAMAVRVTDRM
ncbi:efflux RND transporter periplasmic adaptor subunit [Paracoccus sp. S-4012]|uniref:efflux RND transporter periplasmic adaptor subunit n=1 Tax=Paracoccus sp. S-4012 TaxID=2665648 RepID=UPI0018A23663|nr:efflux RND transporter periplasmic adaptor subunit [Paracoccus sp. S-4012]